MPEVSTKAAFMGSADAILSGPEDTGTKRERLVQLALESEFRMVVETLGDLILVHKQLRAHDAVEIAGLRAKLSVLHQPIEPVVGSAWREEDQGAS